MRGRWTRNEMPTGHRPKSEREKRKRNPKENGEIKTSHRTRKIENKRTGHVPSLWPHWPPFTGLFFFYLPSFVRSGSLFWVGWSSFGTSVACLFNALLFFFTEFLVSTALDASWNSCPLWQRNGATWNTQKNLVTGTISRVVPLGIVAVSSFDFSLSLSLYRFSSISASSLPTGALHGTGVFHTPTVTWSFDLPSFTEFCERVRSLPSFSLPSFFF